MSSSEHQTWYSGLRSGAYPLLLGTWLNFHPKSDEHPSTNILAISRIFFILSCCPFLGWLLRLANLGSLHTGRIGWVGEGLLYYPGIFGVTRIVEHKLTRTIRISSRRSKSFPRLAHANFHFFGKFRITFTLTLMLHLEHHILVQ